jgi:hydroxypyruvate isomerase
MPSTFQPSVCTDAVFEGRSLDQALAGVREAGLPAFEFWAWWEKDLDDVLRGKETYGLDIASCCTKFISLTDPALRADYLQGLRESVAAAQTLGCKTLISQVGDERTGVPRAEQHASLVEGLKQAAPILEDAGVTLVIEPLNTLIDHPGYYLVESGEAFDVVDEVGSPNVKVVFDIYHQQISEGHLIHNLAANLDKVGHLHAAGNPGRHELDRGEINYPEVFRAVREGGYTGYVGLEYWPVGDPVQGLKTVAGWF